jgi:hypothetical protein
VRPGEDAAVGALPPGRTSDADTGGLSRGRFRHKAPTSIGAWRSRTLTPTRMW